IMNDAVAAWESIITGYQPGITVTGVTIETWTTGIDGPGGTLAGSGQKAGTNANQGGYVLATQGQMLFDNADIDALETNGLLFALFLHEIAHVIGVGTLWDENGVNVLGSGEYTGAAGLAAYQKEFDPSATFVPIELTGGSGVADVHWDESGGSSPVVVDPSSPHFGEALDDSLMTAFLSGSNFLSWTTVASLVDIGFTIADNDGDGIPDSYENAHGLDPGNCADAGTDPDGDGYTALAEYLFGTDENNAGSVFAVELTNVDVSGAGSVDVTYGPVFAGLTYQLHESTDGVSFSPLGAAFAPGADAPTHTETDAAASAGVKVYRVTVTGNELP
ncbi:MAG: hypothetical protein HKO57_02815, partial [Akkermansiaceae bacterium]|nr:hypothetical protein [Akkermansiaceae bacterium]